MAKQAAKNYAVIGLGLFGGSICKTLVKRGQEVLAIDSNETVIDDYAPLVTQAVIADATDEIAMKNLALGQFDHVFICIGQNMQASIMATLIMKELGAKNVICKAESPLHARVLKKVGADQVIQPEVDMGRRVAERILEPNILHYLMLNKDVSLSDVRLENKQLVGQTLRQLALNDRYQVTVIAISHQDQVHVSPSPDTELMLDDRLTVVGKATAVDKFNQIASA
ncbi:TrkA domain-containing protein [Lentilactobacillus senioris DSM 24302 = JCM 17472]|uniref:TrkA domain-containing protein n=1 Tax=Lentilactobacillus senioris DSM 24302 = JCM 17472 TaxID=1423802 RepID=A0A0R2CT82_9LACO|nr:TrkA family potassium uptake protein [Lentilactobacillus senioris]KRM94570.1 TrkA domain-containing protein [Lentilactobacillus senioris DSM 24302 = JCM 17472]